MPFLAGLLLLIQATPALAVEFSDQIERDFPLRTIGELQITNTRGDVVIQGWSLDKVRVKAKRKAVADDEVEARKLFSALDFTLRTLGADLELLAEYGRGLDIESRLKERAKPRTSMEMQVFAPANLRLRVWAMNGKVTVHGWSAPMEIRTSEGPIHVDTSRAETISVLCPSCPIELSEVRGSLRAMGGSGSISIVGVDGPQIYVESGSGSIQAERIEGEQLYVSKTGNIRGDRLKGRVEFHSQHGAVEIQDAEGFLSGSTDTGDIQAKMTKWRFRDKALVESLRGRIDLTLPSGFAGDLDVWSIFGTSQVDFPLAKAGEQQIYGPEPVNHLVGRVSDGGEILRVFSEKGDIHVIRGAK